MLSSLTLASRTFAHNLIQGPLAGISAAPFRRLSWRYSQPAFQCTEMLSCATLLAQPHASQKRYISKDANEGPLCFQLSTDCPTQLAAATQMATDLGADLIDLNCGCPMPKIRRKGAGSRLLTEPQKLYQLMRAMKDNTSVPVSIKIRVQSHTNDKFNDALIAAIQDAGIDYVIVHGRHWTEHYETACNYAEIKYFVQHLKIPVIGNGDVADVSSLQRMFATGCAGVMIARAGVGQPWLIQKLRAALSGETFIEPTIDVRGALFLEHVQGLIALLENEKRALLQARGFAKYYARGLKQQKLFSLAVQDCHTWVDLQKTVRIFFKPEWDSNL